MTYDEYKQLLHEWKTCDSIKRREQIETRLFAVAKRMGELEKRLRVQRIDKLKAELVKYRKDLEKIPKYIAQLEEELKTLEAENDVRGVQTVVS